ncbi:hypothetical protein F4779DRAFT_617488 [Xylariaceae sp. FL0662B]|nr:hypothetical protein F4779DRAFT_617488 [Xylariaceae sp. FL0662B]
MYKELEDELRVLVFDFNEAPSRHLAQRSVLSKEPHIIIGNVESGCHGLYFVRPDGTEFVFHHASLKYATQCRCLERGEPGDMTLQLPDYLDYHRLQLIVGRGPRMEPKLAAMVVMKLFLGMDVPEPLRFDPESVLKRADSGKEVDKGDRRLYCCLWRQVRLYEGQLDYWSGRGREAAATEDQG